MNHLTFGQLFIMFDAMAQYVILTNPLGSGETDKPGDRPSSAPSDLRRNVQADGYGGARVAMDHGATINTYKTGELPPHLKVALGR